MTPLSICFQKEYERKNPLKDSDKTQDTILCVFPARKKPFKTEYLYKNPY